MKEKYYTPAIEEFHVGFEFEMKRNFGDGTVKTLEEYNNASWIKQTYDSKSFPYVERTMTGENPNNLPPAIRAKYLDEVDIGDMLGVECKIGGSYQFTWDSVFRPNWLYGAHVHKVRVYFHPDENWVKIEFYLAPDGEWEKFFEGSVKNKSEMQTILKSLGIV